jgi:hypothetical protein
MRTATHSYSRLQKMLITAIAVMILLTGFAPAAYAGHGKHGKHGKGKAIGGDGGDGGIGIGIGLCLIAVCEDVGSGNGAGGDGGDAWVKGH